MKAVGGEAPVPPGVVTATLAGPSAAAGGVLQVIEVSLTTTTLVAACPAKRTDVAPVRPVPETVTAVPPAGGPLFGVTLVTTGAAISIASLAHRRQGMNDGGGRMNSGFTVGGQGGGGQGEQGGGVGDGPVISPVPGARVSDSNGQGVRGTGQPLSKKVGVRGRCQ